MKQFFLALMVLCTSFHLLAQEQQKPILSPRAYVNTKYMDISYGQPSKRNRVIFGELVPYGNVWRAGANEATEITFRKKATFGGKAVDTGTYSLFIIPNEKEWIIILNSQLGQWGAYEYEKHISKNVVEITVPVDSLATQQERLTYMVKKNNLLIQWDKSGVSIPFSFK